MKSLWFSVAIVLLVGCSNKTSVPSKIAVWDVGSGTKFTTYSSLVKPHVTGLVFDDLETGDRVLLTSFRSHTMTPEGSYDKESPEARQYQADIAALTIKQSEHATATSSRSR